MMFKLQNHIRQICRHKNVKINFTLHGGASALWGCSMPEIWIFPLRRFRNYATAMHELGHIHTSLPLRRYPALVREIAAWDWAKRNALVWNSEMEARRIGTLWLWQKHCPPYRR
jgi:hypothetical protein